MEALRSAVSKRWTVTPACSGRAGWIWFIRLWTCSSANFMSAPGRYEIRTLPRLSMAVDSTSRTSFSLRISSSTGISRSRSTCSGAAPLRLSEMKISG